MAVSAPRKDGELSAAGFERLLRCLDEDRERAGEKYEAVRGRLAKLFEWRGCREAESLVDLTFDRVARRLEEGAEIHARDPYSFFHGVALNVLHEFWRGPQQKERPLPERVERIAASPPPDPTPEAECLDGCVGALAAPNRRLILAYHEGRGQARIRAREALAASLGVSATALRLRVFRLRAALAACVEACLHGETDRSGRALKK
jgi:DNA-directed RNA polymerase specialized sigma24 family protein